MMLQTMLAMMLDIRTPLDIITIIYRRDCADDDNPCFRKSISGQSILSVKPCISKEDQ